MLRPSQFQLNSGNTSDSEKTFKLKPSQLTVTSPLAASSSASSAPTNNTPGNNKSNNSPSQTSAGTKDSDGESSNSNSGSLFTNPFMRGFSRDEDSPSKLEGKDAGPEKKDENLDPLAKLSGSASTGGALPKSNLFNVKAATLSSGSGFVFGQNIGERVTGQSANIFGTVTKESDEKTEKKDETESSCNGAGSSGSGLFFSNVATNSNNVEAIESKESDGKSLLEATREYEESEFWIPFQTMIKCNIFHLSFQR